MSTEETQSVVETAPGAESTAAPSTETTPVETKQEETKAAVEQEGIAAAEAAGRAEAEELAGEGEEEVPEYKPNLKFKAGYFNRDTKQLEQKEYDIDPKFHGIMKDAESEKLVKELHEKAFGLQSVKERFDITRQESAELQRENREMVKSVDSLRNIYHGAVRTNNWHKMDDFFRTLQIPEEHILKYALAKVQLAEASPEQRAAVMGQLEAERRAETLAQSQEQLSTQTMEQQMRVKSLEIDHTLLRPEISPLAQAWDERTGKPGSFRELVRREGEIAWFTEKVDLTPEQATKRVIENYGLANGTHGLPAAQTPQQVAPTVIPKAAAQKNMPTSVASKPVPTIPNIQSRSTSPIPGKTKTMDELLKYRKEQHGF